MSRYTVTSMKTRKGMMWYVYDGNTEVYRTKIESAARSHADMLNNRGPAPVTETPAPAQSTGQTGWSKASQRRAGTHDLASQYMADAFGLRSPTAGTTTCHYCGLDRRTCDCN